MIQRRSLLRAAAAVSVGAPCLSGIAQQSITWKFHTFMTPASDTWALLCKPWMDKVTTESQGRIKFEGYPSQQLGGTPPQLYDQLKDGVIDVTWTLPGLSGGRFPRTEVFELPFLMNNAEATSKAFWEYVQTNAPQEYKDVHLLALHVSGPGVIHSRRKAIYTAADMKGMKVRAPSRQVTKLLSALGAVPIGMPLPMIPDGLSKGTIEATVLPWQTVPAVKVDELCKFHSEFPAATGALYTTTFVMAANKEKYEALAPDLKRVIDNNSGLATSAWCGKTTASTDPVGRKIVSDRGNAIHTISAADAAEFVKVSAQVEAEWIAEMSKRDINGKALVDSAKALIAKHGRV